MACLVNAMGIVSCEVKYRLVSGTQVICGYRLHLFPERRRVDRNGRVKLMSCGTVSKFCIESILK
jgi:hypothetical protein